MPSCHKFGAPCTPPPSHTLHLPSMPACAANSAHEACTPGSLLWALPLFVWCMRVCGESVWWWLGHVFALHSFSDSPWYTACYPPPLPRTQTRQITDRLEGEIALRTTAATEVEERLRRSLGRAEEEELQGQQGGCNGCVCAKDGRVWGETACRAVLGEIGCRWLDLCSVH